MISKYEQLDPVIFGAGAIKQLGDEVKNLGGTKAMLIYDAGVKAAGVAEKVEALLKDAGIDYVTFDKILADPPVEVIDEGAYFGREAKIDIVIGLGGGSTMDASKMIAVFQTVDPPCTDHLVGPPKTLLSQIPIILLPTSSGTGSEVTKMAILSDHKKNIKSAIFSRATLAIVDPELTLTMPPGVTAYTGLDALSHCIESLTGNSWNPHSEALALYAIEKIRTYLPIACKDGGNPEARTQMSAASNLAGIAFNDTDVHYGHCVADGLSLVFHTPHGYNCALATPEVLKASATVRPDRVKIVGTALGVSFTGSESGAEIGEKTASAVRELLRACGIQSLQASGKSKEDTMKAVPFALEGGPRYNAPFEVTEEITAVIVEGLYDNYI